MNIRLIIKKEMYQCGAEKYRITAAGEVHSYGVMPNAHRTGWYLKHHDAAAYANQILSDIAWAALRALDA
jgi:hypothetical protein